MSRIMKCSVCQCVGHNKRTCAFSVAPPEVPRSEIRAAAALAALLPPPKKVSKPLEDISSCQNIWKEPSDYYTKSKCRENTCSRCGQKGHNARTCGLSPPKTPSGRHCSACGESGHNARTCLLVLFAPKKKTCSLCGGEGHNSRTCDLKCTPCASEMIPSQIVESPIQQKPQPVLPAKSLIFT